MSSKTQVSVFLATFILAAHEVTAQATVTSTRTIALPTARPSNAFNVPADFPSVGFETAFLSGYNNEFSNNLVMSLASRMAAPPVIRIGGTSGDIITFNPDQEEAAHCVAEPCNSAATFILGTSYFDALSRFNSAHFSIQAPLTESNPNRTNIIAYIQRAYNALGASRVNAIALGNEVNWYEDNAAQYVADAQAAKNAISSVLDIDGDLIWEVLDTASEHASTGRAPYTVKGAFDAGINRDNQVKYVAEHYYQFDGKTRGIQNHLLNHTALRRKLGNYSTSIQYTRNTAGAKFIISEAGGPLGVTDDVQTFFANTLWAVNFQLYAMSLGVSRATLVQRPEARRSLWIPTAGLAVPGPRVQAPYYALPFVADFIGKTVSGTRGVTNIDLGSPFISAYTMFEGTALARIAVVNLREYAGEGTRNAVKIRLENLGNIDQVQVGRLHAAAGTAAGGFDVNGRNITWAGQEWSYQVDRGNGHGTEQRTTLPVAGGVVEVVIPDTEAVIELMDELLEEVKR
ncbi:Beta-glucuronidase [Madurella mycetomatis]|uniref:Beta-glucuronidase n=1 Tax=Madurella mycetomatis TaxID=100816 RepID=A0A175W5A3_9PEZI|nr:Beta-glucuronidase [Madurella mycetomatis]